MKKIIYLLLPFFLFSCGEKSDNGMQLLDESSFQKDINGKDISLYTLDSGNGLVLQVTNYGLRVVSIWAPDKKGNYADVAIGYENIDRYLNNDGERFLGCIVGRYANRIANGKFELGGVEYKLPQNNNGQTLHGGNTGLDGVVWKVDKVMPNFIQFSHLSNHGEEGFPGNVKISVTYELTPENEFKIEYKASTDKQTVINLSNHTFFNLKGEGNGTITDHVLTIDADYTTPVTPVLIPTGEILSVEGTPFDFRKPIEIGARINNDDIQLTNGLGYDHNWVLNKETENELKKAITLYEPESGRILEVYTNQPGVQFYSGNFFDGKVSGKYGKPIAYREALALETQKFPDSPNHPHFPSTCLNPGEEYHHVCIYKFSVQ